MQINLLFPTPVYHTVDENDVCKREQLRNACLEIAQKSQVRDRPKNEFQRVTTSHLVDEKLHQKEEFSALVSFIEENSKSFLKSLGFPSSSLEIIQMWTNVGKKGDFVYPHTHSGEAFLSGAFYVKCIPRDGITFHYSHDRTPPEVDNPLNYTTYFYEGMEGRLLLFRSETVHSTFPQEGDERIVISFNQKLIEPS